MTLHVETHDDVVVVSAPSGMIADGDILDSTLRELIQKGHQKLLLDLGKTNYLTSRPIGILVGVQANAFRNNAALYLCNVDRKIHNVLVILWLTRVLNVLGTRAEALRFLARLDLQLRTDDFEFHASRVDQLNTVLAYQWANSGAVARVDQAASLSAGGGVVRVRDALGHEVYVHSLQEAGAFTTASGKPGDWRIELDFSDFTGPVDLGIHRV